MFPKDTYVHLDVMKKISKSRSEDRDFYYNIESFENARKIPR